jgi:hypothetical protein
MGGEADFARSTHPSWLFVLRGIADMHQLRSGWLIELEAIRGNVLIQANLCNLQVELIVILGPLDAQYARE